MNGLKRIRQLEQEYDILYQKNVDEDVQECVKIFRILLLVNAVCSVCFFLVSWPIEQYHNISYPYGFLSIWHLAMFLLIRKYNPTIRQAPIFYIYNLITTIILALAGLVAPEGLMGYGIIIMLVFIPMVVPGSYKHIFIYEYVLAGVYIVILYQVIPLSFFIESLLMVMIFATMGWIMGIFIQRLRLQELELRRQIEIQRSIDQVTGIKNRRMLFERLSSGINKDIIGIAMIDIDDFKQYNDTYGHVEGDRCLNSIGTLMTEYGCKNHIDFFRYGGEEFVGIIHGTDVDVMQLMMNFNKAVVDLKIKHESSEIGVLTVSIGVVRINPNEENDYEKLIKYADDAMYEAKGSGKNKTILYK